MTPFLCDSWAPVFWLTVYTTTQLLVQSRHYTFSCRLIVRCVGAYGRRQKPYHVFSWYCPQCIFPYHIFVINAFDPKQMGRKIITISTMPCDWHYINLQTFAIVKTLNVCTLVPHWHCPHKPWIYIKIWLLNCKNCSTFCGSSLRPLRGLRPLTSLLQPNRTTFQTLPASMLIV